MEHLTDAPVANILILAGIMFVAVGLFGRIGGFIGSIFGTYLRPLFGLSVEGSLNRAQA